MTPVKDVLIVTSSSAYTNGDGITYILLIHKALYYGDKLSHSLINPNQIRNNDVEFWDNPYDRSKSLYIKVHDTLNIPLQLHGTKVFFESRTPTKKELLECMHIDLTSESPWNPTEIQLEESASTTRRYFASLDECLLETISPSLANLSRSLKTFRSVQILTLIMYKHVSHMYRMRDIRKITAERLAEKFCIGTDKAKTTLKTTTQRGVRSAISPLSKRHSVDRVFKVPILYGKFITDTI